MDAGVWELISEASLVVQGVMLVLVLMSVISWFIMGAKWKQLGSAQRRNRDFLQVFWGQGHRSYWDANRLQSIYSLLSGYGQSPIAKVFHAGYIELARIADGVQAGQSQPPQAHGRIGGDVHNVERAMRRSESMELTRLESMLQFLATTGSTAPFIGLFGTVWGIMNSFMSIRAQGNASLDVVGGDIAEALIATALGLAAAIPAVMAYNYFVRRVRLVEGEIDAFENDFLNIARRHFLTS